MFTFIESAAFDRVRDKYLDGSGSVRKLRWVRRGGGKRGGLRVVYYVRYQPNEFWMLALYAKAQLKNIPAHILRELKREFGND